MASENGSRSYNNPKKSTVITTGTYKKQGAFKELHRMLADVSDDELKSIEIVPTGTFLLQGSKYIDLLHLE